MRPSASGEDAQRADLVGQPVGLGVVVVVRDAEQHEQPGADRRDLLAVDADGGPADPLDQGAHGRDARPRADDGGGHDTIAVVQATARGGQPQVEAVGVGDDERC